MSGDVYVLALESGKYYVGYSSNIEKRLRDHFNHAGSEWTKKYKPIKVIQREYGKDKAHETQITLDYMREYGWKNVRGGPYTQVIMEHPPPEFEKGMTCSICRSDQHLVKDCLFCVRCKREGHKERDCYARTDINGKSLSAETTKIPKSYVCYRCGRSTHMYRDCYATVDVDGYEISSDED